MMRTILKLAALGGVVTMLSLAVPAKSQAGGPKNFGFAVNTPRGSFSFYSGGFGGGYGRDCGPNFGGFNGYGSYNRFGGYNDFYRPNYGPVVGPYYSGYYPQPTFVLPSRRFYGGYDSPYGWHR